MKFGIAALMVLLAGPAVGQEHRHGQSPYTGLQQRALAAELNGYPGPIHVLELADRLQLTAAQRLEVQRLYEAMKDEAIPVGEKLIEHETALDQQFAVRKVTPGSLASLTAKIGETQGQLRAVHLKYHLTTAALLSADQRALYAQLRGYR